jgi:hypothetical protein
MNKPIIMMAMAALAVLVSSAAASLSVASGQGLYGGSPGGGTASPEQLKECQQIGIPEGNCNDVTILAKRRVIDAQTTTYGNNAYGSGTPYFQGIETWGVIGALAAIFGGVAAAFFFKGRGAKPIST